MARTLLTTFIIALAVAIATAQELTVPPALAERLADGDTVDVLAMFEDYPDLSGADALGSKAERGAFVFAALTQYRQGYRPLLEALDADGIPYRELWSAGAIYFPDAEESLLASLEEHAEGLTLAPSYPVTIDAVERAPVTSDRGAASVTWGLEYIGAPEVWARGIRGEGVVIGGQDTGYDWDHPALKRSYRGYDAPADTAAHDYNWYDAVKRKSPLNTNVDNPCGYNTTAACDDGSHGTHAMGTMTGAVAGDTIGVAPAATWIGCRNMDRGDGTPQQYLECFQWFLAPTDTDGDEPRPELAPDVIANSWYCPLSEGCDPATYPAFRRATQALRAAGVVVVVSAGNAGPGCNTVNEIPASVDGVVSVAAHDVNGDIAGFSSRGASAPETWPSLAAPGVDIRSAVPPSGYANFQGTSMAGPHVAGVVALMISANPRLRGNVDSLEALLLRAARPAAPGSDDGCSEAGDPDRNAVFGHGTLSAVDAVALARGEALSSTGEAATQTLPVAVAPNPITNLLTLRTGLEALGSRLLIVDAAGRRVAEATITAQRTEILSDAWAPGVYLWRIAGEAGVASGRVLKP